MLLLDEKRYGICSTNQERSSNIICICTDEERVGTDSVEKKSLSLSMDPKILYPTVLHLFFLHFIIFIHPNRPQRPGHFFLFAYTRPFSSLKLVHHQLQPASLKCECCPFFIFFCPPLRYSPPAVGRI